MLFVIEDSLKNSGFEWFDIEHTKALKEGLAGALTQTDFVVEAIIIATTLLI